MAIRICMTFPSIIVTPCVFFFLEYQYFFALQTFCIIYHISKPKSIGFPLLLCINVHSLCRHLLIPEQQILPKRIICPPARVLFLVRVFITDFVKRKSSDNEIRYRYAYWCGQQDSNLHGRPLEPKSNVSANSTMPADMFSLFYHVRISLSMYNPPAAKMRKKD